MTNEELQTAWQRRLAARGPERSGCTSPEDLLRIASAPVQDERDAGVFDHVMGCAACRSEYELLRSTAAPTARPVIRWTRWVPLAAAAVLVLAVGLPTLREPEAPPVVRSSDPGEIVMHGPVAARAGAALTLAWGPVAGADAYRVEVTDTLGVVLHTETTGDTMVVVRAEVLPAGSGAFDWLVVARRADGNERRSPLARVAVNP